MFQKKFQKNTLVLACYFVEYILSSIFLAFVFLQCDCSNGVTCSCCGEDFRENAFFRHGEEGSDGMCIADSGDDVVAVTDAVIPDRLIV